MFILQELSGKQKRILTFFHKIMTAPLCKKSGAVVVDID